MDKLTLSALPASFAIGRLSPSEGAAAAGLLTEGGCFLSVTRTPDEVSVVGEEGVLDKYGMKVSM